MSAVQTGTPTSPKPAKKNALGGRLYRGNEGMWSWVLHRITGVAIFFFLLVHVLDSGLLLVSPEVYNAVIGAYKNPIMGIGELGLVAAIVYHAFNGLRIILIDFMPGGTRHHKLMFWIVIAIWALVMIPFAYMHLSHVFGF
ncbi:succinate dehydrogenase, cytochrome b556 subunit [Gulosibacter sp. 10]|uniref:succinate dehydrogenase, cytochrome b556 subunit n=1 Tax=Gulosibacter sp. 10 TaxID=1255570 RepID=UPI00097EDAC9|nr:succinate dehydrogenase, cytochrome b556 subunit [Gulosibacter sp. 10]SJM47810.1 Succinate dehydrogenase cytochrome b-556 subunit [Gulosibacter sp. 10]